MVLVGGMDTGWKPGGGRIFLFFLSLELKTQPNRISAKSSLFSDDAAQGTFQLVVEMWRACEFECVCVCFIRPISRWFDLEVDWKNHEK